MQPSLSPADNDPHDVLEIAPDVVLVARAEEELSRLARDAKKRSGDRSSQARVEPTLPQTDAAVAAREVPAVDTSFRAAAIHDGPSMARRLGRGLAGLLLAVVIGGTAVAWRASGEVVKEAIANFAPAFAAKVLPAADPSAQAAQDPAPAAAPVQQAAAETPEAAQDAPSETTPAATPPAATTPAATPPAATTPTATSPAPATTLAAAAAAAIPADQSQRLQSMARDLASLGQEVAVLKASLAELKASNEQMSHDMAKLSEQNQRLKVSAMQAKAALPARKPVPTFRPTQAAASPPPYPPAQAAPYPPPQTAPYPPPAAAPYPPPQTAYVPPPAPVAQPQADPDIPRPPMPVRQ